MRVVIGIDPGVGGAVAAVDATGRLIAVHDTPTLWMRRGGGRRHAYDIAAMRLLIVGHVAAGAVHAVIEHQHAMSGQGVTSMFSTGYGYGLWVGLLTGLGLPHTIVAPRRWQAAMLMGRGGGDSKAQSVAAAGRLFPDVVIPRTRHGRADALLIVEYGRRLLNGGAERQTGAAS